MVIQQAYAVLLGHYLLRAWMHRAAREEPGLDTDRLDASPSSILRRRYLHIPASALSMLRMFEKRLMTSEEG